MSTKYVDIPEENTLSLMYRLSLVYITEHQDEISSSKIIKRNLRRFYRKYLRLIKKNRLNKKILKSKNFNDYRREYAVLTDMFRCSTRCMSERMVSNRRQFVRVHRLYSKISSLLNKECIESTGKRIFCNGKEWYHE